MRRLFISNEDESPKIFKNGVLDLLSRTSWYAPAIFWLPVLSGMFIYTLSKNTITLEKGILYFCLSIAFWTLTEYILHRFVFHYRPTTELGQRIHFIFHGIHHDYPRDSKRLVLPPSLSFVFSLPFFALFYATLGQYYIVFFIGFMLGYVCYDTCHYALHHAKWDHPIFTKLKEQHMLHHYNDPDHGYGVTSAIWDKVFKTSLKK